VIFGHSLGAAIAIDLASRKRGGLDYDTLVVESAFTSIAKQAAQEGYPRFVLPLITQKFNSESKIGHVDGKIWILHGDADTSVPIEFARQLKAVAPAKAHLIEFVGGTHENMERVSREKYLETFYEIFNSVDATQDERGPR
jgi:pimeloyl-ACP methyl ester carboxylesterase